MAFDSKWFNELRELSTEKLQDARARGIERFVPHVGELCEYGHISSRFLDETSHLIDTMSRKHYRFDPFFRAFPRHVADWPARRAFRKQWNIGFSAGDCPGDDFVRVGIGFRLSAFAESRGIEDYLEFRENVRREPKAFDKTFQALGNYYEFLNLDSSAPGVAQVAMGPLSSVIIGDEPPLNGWRFFGRRLFACQSQDQFLIGSHGRLRDVCVGVFEHVRRAGFGM